MPCYKQIINNKQARDLNLQYKKCEKIVKMNR